MSYFEQLYPWCIVKPLENLQWRVLARFRRRNDAEAHLRVLRRLVPQVQYQIVFDVPLEEGERPEAKKSMSALPEAKKVTPVLEKT